MSREPGSLGQFDVVADGEVVATRKGGLVAILGGGWPSADEVMKALASRAGTGGAAS